MNLADFDFSLPDNLIAKYPVRVRRESRLLFLNRSTGNIEHHRFFELPDLLSSSDLLVLNDSKVVPARLFAFKQTGGKVEILLEKPIDDRLFLAISHANRSLKLQDVVYVKDHCIKLVNKQDDGVFTFEILTNITTDQLFDRYGEIPLPPYLQRSPEYEDKHRYQTVYAKFKGSCAAPTAGLHFDEHVFSSLRSKGILCDYLTLHVGLGTFKPLKEGPIEQQKLHAERVYVSEELVKNIKNTKNNRKGRVIAVGTTSLRSLETAALSGELKHYSGDSDLFIYPGKEHEFRVVDGLITNFHLPKTSLLMLVCALAGYELVMKAYKEAINEGYRFFSYGDSMLIL